jgi:3-oxoadipate enol-lactonase/4-carboxymuconolactone decarboxylase
MMQHRIDGPATAPPLVLGPSLGTSLAVWEPCLPELARTHRVLRFDLPGHGGASATGEATIADLATAVLHLADRYDFHRFAYAGVSLGGAIGAHLAAHHPHRIESLVMVCSSARFGDPDAWTQRAQLVRTQGTAALADTIASRWFTPAFRHTSTAQALITDLRNADPAGYAACCDALAGYDLRPALASIAAPTLVVAGREDPATPPSHARELVDGIPGATLLELPHAAHLATVQRPAEVTAAILAHLGICRHTAGMAMRRAVLGDAHVDRAVAATTGFTAAFQDFITRYAWGEIWTRPGLDRRTRSCITLTALVALGHHHELAMHVRAATRNGLTPDEIGEVLLHSAVYCGVPAANAAFTIAQNVLNEPTEPEVC